MIRRMAFGLLLTLTACAQTDGGTRRAAPVHAAKPPSDHILIGSVENTDSKDVHVGINSAVMVTKQATDG